MKMTKIESARIIVANNGRCIGLKGEVEVIECNRCFNGWNQDKCKDFTEDKILALAKAYIKRHESKSKKKDHILDTTKKVEEPKPIKMVGIDNSDVALTAQHEPTPLQIAKMIRDNGYVCLHIWDCTRQCPISNSKTGQLDCSINRKQLIDDYISANEPVKDCPANSEIPQPVKLPDFVYSASKNGVGFIDTKNRTFNTNDKGELLINDKPCFATPEEALQVAKKLWGSK